MERLVLIPFVVFEVVINVYLTALFLTHVSRLYSYKTKLNPALKTVASRTLVGSCITIVSTVTNITTLGVLNGEMAWICVMVCNADSTSKTSPLSRLR
jgi:hypothetical protein